LILLDGSTLAKKLEKQIQQDVASFAEKSGVTPGLATVQVGNNPASSVYVGKKHQACKKVGIRSERVELDEDVSQEALLGHVLRLNLDPAIHGILVQLPLPKHLDASMIIQSIDPAKDVDGFHLENVGRLYVDGSGLVPCTPQGVMALLGEYDVPIAGKRAVVVGRSLIVGKPVAQLLLSQNATVTIAHSKSENIRALCKEAQILVVAAGQPEMVRHDWVAPGACVVDVGIHRNSSGKIVGDVNFDEVSQIAGFLSPVPGGVGPLTISMLMQNTLKAARGIHVGK